MLIITDLAEKFVLPPGFCWECETALDKLLLLVLR
jgi:hypothetical protein